MKLKTVYAGGCWDLMHHGHISFLEKCKSIGDLLVVGVGSDELIQNYKKIKTSDNQFDRLKNISNLDTVDMAFILKDAQSQRKYIDIIKPDIIAYADDGKMPLDKLKLQMNLGNDQILNYDIQFIFMDYTRGISSTMLREKLKINS